MTDAIDCPHCNGTGKVAEDFLTDDHVSDVFRDYCEVFNVFHAYGVERYEEYGDFVSVKQDTSCRGCYNSETHRLPVAYFTRNQERRLELMQADLTIKQAAEAKKSRQQKRAALVQAEATAERLRKELGNG